jgi:hypothetical protein
MAARLPKWVPFEPVFTFENGFFAREDMLKRKV